MCTVLLPPGEGKGKAVPLQVWSGSEGSRKLMLPDFMKTAQNGGKVVSLTHRPPLPILLISVRGWVNPRVIVRSERFYVNEKFQWNQLGSNQRRFVAQHLNHWATAVPTATGCQPHCNQQIYHIISYNIKSNHIISSHISSAPNREIYMKFENFIKDLSRKSNPENALLQQCSGACAIRVSLHEHFPSCVCCSH